MSPYEYRLLADGFSDIDDFDQAEAYFIKAVAKATHTIDRSIIIRSYGRLIFIEGRHDEARKKFESALAEIVGTGDRATFYRLETLERWSILEGEIGNFAQQRQLLDAAISQARNYANSKRSTAEVARLLVRAAAINPNGGDAAGAA